jgi:alpha/beta superfamily hydrolase
MTDPLPEPRGHVLFSGDDRLEGILEWPADAGSGGRESAAPAPEGGAPSPPAPSPRLAGGVVIAHPHPLFGGTMAQPVVYRVAQACREQGLGSLRFNFRGVGRSAGHYSGTEEYRDVEAALAFLKGRLDSRPEESGGPGAPGGVARRLVEDPPGGRRRLPLGLAGYSFGSVMAALAAGHGEVPVESLALIALVVDWEELPPGTLDWLARFRGPVLALCGELDDLAPPAVVEKALRGLGVDFRLEVLARTDHFFEQRQREVGQRVAAFFAETLSGRRLAR